MAKKIKKDSDKFTGRFEFRLPEALNKDLKDIATFKGMGAAALVRMWVIECIRAEKLARKKYSS